MSRTAVSRQRQGTDARPRKAPAANSLNAPAPLHTPHGTRRRHCPHSRTQEPKSDVSSPPTGPKRHTHSRRSSSYPRLAASEAKPDTTHLPPCQYGQVLRPLGLHMRTARMMGSLACDHTHAQRTRKPRPGASSHRLPQSSTHFVLPLRVFFRFRPSRTSQKAASAGAVLASPGTVRSHPDPY